MIRTEGRGDIGVSPEETSEIDFIQEGRRSNRGTKKKKKGVVSLITK